MPAAFHHAAVAVSDLAVAVPFYEDVLGLDPVGPDDPDADVETAAYYWMAVGDDQWLNLARRPDSTPVGTGDAGTDAETPPVNGERGALDDPHLALRVSEAEQAGIRNRALERDVDVHESPTSLYLRDPDGNLLEATVWDGPE